MAAGARPMLQHSVQRAVVGCSAPISRPMGSVGFFGPITVDPALQETGIGKALLAATMDQFDAWGTTQVGLFTFAHSAKHVALYQKFGFHARFLTAIMSATAQRGQVKGRLVTLERIER